MNILITVSKIRSRRIFATLFLFGAVASGWLSANEPDPFSSADREYIKEHCQGDDYDQWIKVPAEEDITDLLIGAGFVKRQAIPDRSAPNRQKRSVIPDIPEPYVSPAYLTDWVGDKAYFWCLFKDAEYYPYQPYTIKWFHNGRRFCPGGNPSIYGFSLEIDPVTPESNGTYECEYRGLRSGVNGEFRVFQKIRATGSHVTAGLGQPATVSCPVSEGMPAPDIYWRRINNPDQVNFNASDIFLYNPVDNLYASGDDINFSVNGEFLHFDAVQEKDYGIIQCWIQNEVDTEVVNSELLRPGVLLVFHDSQQSHSISKSLIGHNTNTGLCVIHDETEMPPKIVADTGQVQVSGLGGRLKLYGFDKNRQYQVFKGIDGGIVENKGIVTAEPATSTGDSGVEPGIESGFHYSDTCPGDYIPSEESPSPVPAVIGGSGNDYLYINSNHRQILFYGIVSEEEASGSPESGSAGSNAISTVAYSPLLLLHTLVVGFMLNK